VWQSSDCRNQAITLIENLLANVDRQSQGVHPVAFSLEIYPEPSCLLSSQVQNLSRYVLTPSGV
jgi:hypothetical protein